MRTKLLGLMLLAGIAATSCKKDRVPENNNVNSVDEIKAPAGFSWSGSRDVRLSIGVTDNRFQNQIHIIKVYSGDPDKGGELLSKGSGTLTMPFNTKFVLTSQIKQLFVQKVAPNGAIVKEQLALTSDQMSLSIGESSILNVKSVGRPIFEKISALRPNITIPTEASPNCDMPYDVEITQAIANSSANEYQLLSGKVYVIKQNGVNITFNKTPEAGSILRICGSNVTVNGFKIQNQNTIVVSSGATNVNLGNFQWDGTGTFKNFGETTVGNLTVKGTFVNQGTLKMGNSTLTITSGTMVNTSSLSCDNFIANAPYSNSGTMNVKGFTASAAGNNTGTINASEDFKNTSTFSTTGTLVLSKELQLQSGSDFSNTGNITVSGNSSITGDFYTSGIVNFNGTQSIHNAPGTTENSGIINAPTNSELGIETNRVFRNNGTVTIGKLKMNTGSSEIINNCKWFVTNSGHKNEINGKLHNNSYFSVAGGMNINSSSAVTLGAKSMLVTNWIGDAFDKKIVALADTAVVKVTTINQLQNHSNSVKFSGKIHVVYPSTLPAAMFENGATQRISTKTIYIQAGDCMGEGSGTAPVIPPVVGDRDGDGVNDDEDDYPDDASIAYENKMDRYDEYGYTIAFEDSWPLKGDYDLNDVVIRYRYIVATNKLNKVVKVFADYTLLATGGNFQNGAGIEFPIAASKLKTGSFVAPEGVSLESGQDKIVVILFNNSRAIQQTWNTEKGQPVSPSVPFSISFQIEDGPTLEDFGIGNYNPFIWNNSPGFGRGYETHLYGKTPTNKANTALFGTGDDASGGGKYYGTSNNLPWAIQIPIADFKYPIERAPITDAYKKFADWAISGGENSQTWYSDLGNANRDENKLYGLTN